jgi:hypothetical protein
MLYIELYICACTWHVEQGVNQRSQVEGRRPTTPGWVVPIGPLQDAEGVDRPNDTQAIQDLGEVQRIFAHHLRVIPVQFCGRNSSTVVHRRCTGGTGGTGRTE